MNFIEEKINKFSLMINLNNYNYPLNDNNLINIVKFIGGEIIETDVNEIIKKYNNNAFGMKIKKYGDKKYWIAFGLGELIIGYDYLNNPSLKIKKDIKKMYSQFNYFALKFLIPDDVLNNLLEVNTENELSKIFELNEKIIENRLKRKGGII